LDHQIEKNVMGGACGIMGGRKGACRVLVGRPEGRNHSEDAGIGGRITSKWICKKWDGEAWAGLLWQGIGAGGGNL
jgi:hypothetical protein